LELKVYTGAFWAGVLAHLFISALYVFAAVVHSVQTVNVLLRYARSLACGAYFGLRRFLLKQALAH
jgi:hypothetical protein